MNAFLLALAGYVAGHMRRRVASERFTAQIVISLVASAYYAIGASCLYALFDETAVRISVVHIFLEAIYNAVFVGAFFLLTEWWVNFWQMPVEHV